MKIKHILTTFLTFGLVAAWQRLGFAQSLDVPYVETVRAGNFFAAVIAGIVLAVGFQLVLTMLSFASGIAVMGNIEGKFNKDAGAPKEDKKGGGSTATKITSGIGLWMLITSSLSLFFASMLAVKISLIADNQIGLTLGLVIWAGFLLTMIYLETRSAGYVLGGIFSMIYKSLKSSARMAQEMFGKSEAQKTAEAIREEIIQTVQDPDFTGSINKYIRRLQPEPFDWKKARQELTKLLSGLEVKANVRDGEGDLEQETFIRLAQKHFNKEDAQKFGEIFEEVKSAGKAEGGAQEKVMDVVEKLAPGSKEDVEQVKEKVMHYLQSAGIDTLNPERLKEDLNNIIAQPQSAKSVVLNRIKQFDHSTLESIVSKTGNISNEQKSKIVNRIETVLHTIEDKLEHPGGGDGKNIKSAIEDKVRDYFASLQRPEFDYEQIKMDFERMFHDPKAALEILKNRLKQFNRESFVALLSSQSHISSEKAEKIVAKIEEARENTIRKAEEIDRKVKEKLQGAKEAGLHQAENVRRNIAVASWWIFASAVISAGASALGGING